MIEILFPPGCYGTYLARCLYNYTTLRNGECDDFLFDNAGSSHTLRNNLDARSKIVAHHLSTANSKSLLKLNDPAQLITILPDNNHMLDYYNNQYLKQSKGALSDFILSQIDIAETDTKLINGWNYHGPLSTSMPRWILREFLSLWIYDCLISGYSITNYSNIDSKIKITTQDIVLDFNNTLNKICYELNLTINISNEVILANHTNFINSQHYLNSQLNCNSWVNATIDSDLLELNPCQTIFDEAYVQHAFRIRGYEIKCDGLNVMPNTSLEMKTLIYKI